MAQVEAQVAEKAAQRDPQHHRTGPSQIESSSLYVGDLELNVLEDQLYDIFSQVGPVVSICVRRDKITRLSLGYAWVIYKSAEDAAWAVKILNFTAVNGKPMRIMFSCQNPSRFKSGVANVFIKNLEESIDNKALFETFSSFGSILSCKIELDPCGQSKGYGFVQFEQEEAARTAIEKAHGMFLNTKQVFVGPFIPRHQRDQAGGQASQSCNVFVKNFARTTTDEELQNQFVVFGNISSAVVMRDSDGKSKCFGFVSFKTTEEAVAAIKALNGKKIQGKEWYVGRAQRKSEREAELRGKFGQHLGANVYVKNLDDRFDEGMLEKLFAEFGAIRSCKIMRTPQGHSTGSGFVNFSTREEARLAIAFMNRRIVGNKPLFVAPAQRKEERLVRLQTSAEMCMST